MKRKLVIMGDMRLMMKDLFGINDKDVDKVVEFMGKDYDRISDVIKTTVKSDKLTERQKMAVSYIVGNTLGVMQAKDIGDVIGRDHDSPNIGM